jgi:hypothetical protein
VWHLPGAGSRQGCGLSSLQALFIRCEYASYFWHPHACTFMFFIFNALSIVSGVLSATLGFLPLRAPSHPHLPPQLYVDGRQAEASALRQHYRDRLDEAPRHPDFYRRLRSSTDIDLTLMVRLKRNLSLSLLRGYEHMLRRRLRRVGGTPQDPGVSQLMQAFRSVCIPASKS